MLLTGISVIMDWKNQSKIEFRDSHEETKATQH